MKRTIAMAALAAVMIFAGKAYAQLSVNVGYAPVTYSTETTVGSTVTETTAEMAGFFAGLSYNHSFDGYLGLSLGAQARYNIKQSTGSANFVVVTGDSKSKETQLMLDIPVLFNYGINLNSDAKLVAFAGPTFSYALSGNTHVTTTATVLGATSVTETDYPMYDDGTAYNRMDLSGTVGVELHYAAYRLFGGYRMGFLDLNNNDNIKTTSSGLFIGLGIDL
ncbi:MAG: outer membrane beta-barrel protein [Bacteroidales bacterium]|nr:outer membrane beta-barrel protein [Bacteroidales bacterium]